MLKTRIVTALVLLAGFLAVLFLLPKPSAAIIFGALAGLMAWEWAGLMHIDRAGRVFFAGIVLFSCFTAYDQAEVFYPALWWLSVAFWLLIVPLWLWRGWRLDSNDMGGYAVGWILIVPMWAAMVALQDRNPWWLFAAMALVWVADIGAYFAGRAWGQHKLAPAISPGKTWEGVGGGVAGVLVYGIAATLVAGASPLAEFRWTPVLVALAAMSVVGDLFESLMKRQAGVKDSSELLPGHGGLLDRLDSQTSTLPLVALILLGMAT
ncbi:MAG TPA: phosphatidate cytidylyltransferase [Rhodocyclaceae bacterium]|nr:phosphatidate cytidylyltransferase [Rhodocyclaceae bacterium]